MQPIPNQRLIWCQIPANTLAGAAIRLPDVPEIRGRKVIGLESYTSDQLSNTPDQLAVIAPGDASGVVLRLRQMSTDVAYDWPLVSINPALQGGIWKQLMPVEPDYQQSEYFFTKTPAATTFTIPLTVYYL